ncbi:STAS domain-containing protein [Catellatospora chokoriensis]|uniref:STAS domain-containing protein n=1 Tax=Catellatospora chokoriensis TaxID=310353 RepID=UPI00177E0264|nr:STAS domain-containing protein [Catellatospora chokoriensis]
MTRRIGTVIAVAGRLDAGTSAHLARTLGDLLRCRPCLAVTVDLSRLDFIGGTGIGVLALYRAAATRLGVVLRIVDPPPHIRIIIEASGCELLTAAGNRAAGGVGSWPMRCRNRRLVVSADTTLSRQRAVRRCWRPQP